MVIPGHFHPSPRRNPMSLWQACTLPSHLPSGQAFNECAHAGHWVCVDTIHVLSLICHLFLLLHTVFLLHSTNMFWEPFMVQAEISKHDLYLLKVQLWGEKILSQAVEDITLSALIPCKGVFVWSGFSRNDGSVQQCPPYALHCGNLGLASHPDFSPTLALVSTFWYLVPLATPIPVVQLYWDCLED